jgi:phosphatidylserine/phosphatidylglycerophosphate/cardiolipin synthase-like enzyme
MTRLRDSNPVYSGAWRILAGWMGTGGPGWLPHPLSSTGRKVTARSYLKLLNFKANHRKLLVTDRGCLVTSANPHDASTYHSNIAFAGTGEICRDLLASERAVASFSGGPVDSWPTLPTPSTSGEPAPAPDEARGTETAGGATSATADSGPAPFGSQEARVQLVTEGKILRVLLQDLRAAGDGDRIDLAMFYLSNRGVLQALLEAVERGATLRVVLDPNKDAFGREKGGIPNRQTAGELLRKSRGRATVRWFDTHGEQFHTKLVVVTRGDSVTVMGGSANLTRRNIGDYNLETDLRFELRRGSPLAAAVEGYFQRVWENRGGSFTAPFERYRDDSLLKRILYRVQEATGLSSF